MWFVHANLPIGRLTSVRTVDLHWGGEWLNSSADFNPNQNHVNAAPIHKPASRQLPHHKATPKQNYCKINVLISILICEIKIKKSGISHQIFKKSNWRICTERQGEDAVETTRSLLLLYDLYPATAVVLYMLSFGIGVGTVPWLLLGELCPSKVSLKTLILRDRGPSTTACLHCKSAQYKLLFSSVYCTLFQFICPHRPASYTVKKIIVFPSPAGMSL